MKTNWVFTFFTVHVLGHTWFFFSSSSFFGSNICWACEMWNANAKHISSNLQFIIIILNEHHIYWHFRIFIHIYTYGFLMHTKPRIQSIWTRHNLKCEWEWVFVFFSFVELPNHKTILLLFPLICVFNVSPQLLQII